MTRFSTHTGRTSFAHRFAHLPFRARSSLPFPLSLVLLPAVLLASMAGGACVPPEFNEPPADEVAALVLDFGDPTPAVNSLLNSATVTLAGTCTNGLSVTFGADVDSPESADCTDGTFSEEVTLSAGDGAKTVKISQTRDDGETRSRTRGYTLDSTDPLFVAVVAESAALTSSLVASPSISRSADATDTGGSGVAGYEYAVGTTAGATDVKSWTTAESNPFVIDFTASPLTDTETYYVTMRAVDDAGNTSAVVSSAGWTVDASAPALSLGGATPADGAYLDAAAQTIEGSCETGLTISISGDVAAPASTSCVAGAFTQAITLTAGDGAKTVTVTQTDSAANATSDARSYTLDTAVPVFASTADEASAFHNSSTESPDVSWTTDATDVGGSGVSHYEFAVGSTAGNNDVVDWTAVTNGNDNPFTITGIAPALVDTQTYFVSLVAVDLAGNRSAPVDTDGWTVDLVAPVLAYGGATPADGAVVAAASAPIEGSCEDGVTIVVTGDVDPAPTPACALSAFSDTATFTAGDGLKSVTISQTDAAGNVTTQTRTFNVDVSIPSVSSVTIDASDGTYYPGDPFVISVEFDEAVTVAGGTPTLALDTGAAATYTAGSGSTMLAFSYTAAAGESSADLDYTGAGAIALNGATISDSAGNAADTTLPVPGAAGSIGGDYDIRIYPGFDTGTDVAGSLGAGHAVVSADLDRDGNLDLVVGYMGARNSVYFGDGTGAFPVTASVGDVADTYNTADLALVDLDRDGDLDLVEVNDGQANYYYINAGAGVFSAPGVVFDANTDSSLSVATGDFNRDGWQDVAIGNNGADNLVYTVTAGLTFSPTPANLGAGLTYDLAVADVDRDGSLDLVEANFNGPNRLHLGQGDGTFLASSIDSAKSDGTASVAAADFNNDGRPDVAFGNFGASSYVYLGLGNGTFQSAIAFGGSTLSPHSLVAADFDQDGAQDLLAGTQSNGSFLFLGSGGGSFTNRVSIATADLHLTREVVASDFDRDGKLDFVAANQGDPARAYLGVLPWSVTGAFSAGSTLSDAGLTETIHIADFNRDGRPDLLAGNTGGAQTSALYLGDGSGAFLNSQSLGSSSNGKLVVADLDADGDLDAAVMKSGSAAYLPGHGSGFLSAVAISTESGPTEAGLVLDVNLDGAVDAIRGNDGATSRLTLATSPGVFGTHSDVSAATDAVRSLASGHLDGDEFPDLVVGNYGTETVVHLGTDDGSGGFNGFGVGAVIGAPQNTVAVALADLNGDGALDIVQINDGEEDYVYAGAGNGTFGAASAVETGATYDSTGIAIGDLNRDGAPDLVVTTMTSGTVVYYGNGAGAFTVHATLATDVSGTSAAIGDVNLDGAPDIAIGVYGLGNRVYLGGW